MSSIRSWKCARRRTAELRRAAPRRAALLPAAFLLAVFLAAALPAAAAAQASDGAKGTTLIHPPFGHCLGLHRATSFHLFLYLGTRTSFDEPAGIAAVKLDELDDPSTESDDDELTVFGVNSGKCELIYNTSLTNVEIFGECGNGNGQFRHPLGVAADSRGNVFVADTGNNRIVRLLYRDGLLRFVRNLVGADVSLNSPSDVAIGASGALYVADTDNDRVVSMTSTGTLLYSISGDRAAGVTFDRPTAIAMVEGEDRWISRRQDFVVVVDSGGRRIVKTTRDGTLLAMVEATDLPVAAASFDRLAIDYYGSVYATDREHGRIHKFDSALRHVSSIGGEGRDVELDEPRGITLWRRFGQIFVAERAGAQYFWIGTEILGLDLDRERIRAGQDDLTIRYDLTEVARVTIELVDSDGDVAYKLVDDRRRAIGENSELWNGRAGRSGPAVPPGRYTLRITATPTYSSGQYFHDTAEVPIEIVAAAER